ncbi:MAG: tetratricopeptide repeat protein [Planctomycetaceae bacterium]|nr:tetratricopeptide repeat protein [Planctomycetaceae bacterium]
MTLQEAFEQAVRLHQAGQFAQAEGVYRQVVQHVPQYADGWHLLGVLCYQTNRHAEAIGHLNRAVQLQESTGLFHSSLAEAYRAAGQPIDAERHFRRALELDPNLPEAWSNLGLLLNNLGRAAESLPCFDQAVALRPNFGDALLNHALALQSLGRLAEAVTACIAALAAQPADPKPSQLLDQLADQALTQHAYGVACSALEPLVRLRPQDPVTLRRYAVTLQRSGNHRAACEVLERLLPLQPTDAELCVFYAESLSSLGRRPAAIAALERATQLRPTFVEAWNNLGSLYKSGGEHGAALRCFEQGLQHAPHVAALHVNLGSLYLSGGRQDEAIAAYRRAMELEPTWPTAHSGLLQAEQYRSGNTAATLDELHREWDRRHGYPLRHTWRPWTNERDPQRKLRLGFISRDWGRHPIGFLLRDVLRLMPRDQFAICVYSDRPNPDEVTKEIWQLSTVFRETAAFDDAQVAQQVREDQIDVLFDLSGHVAGNRLLTFARKPAPVQVSWLGYVGTTGLSAIDYLFTDDVMVPTGTESHYVEQIVRFQGAPACFTLPDQLPDPGPLPALERGTLTFAGFNNPCKVTVETLDVWSEILRRLPGSRLVLKYFGFDDRLNRERLHGLFAARGVEPTRVELHGYTPLADMLNLYRAMDMTLDPFPYTGGTTTFLSLAMGVPVMTLAGATVGARQSASILHAAQLDDWTTQSPEEYIARVLDWSTRLDDLATLRSQVRQKLLSSPFANPAALAGQLTRVVREIWGKYCREV